MSSSSRSVRPIDRAIRDSEVQTLVSTERSVPATRVHSISGARSAPSSFATIAASSHRGETSRSSRTYS